MASTTRKQRVRPQAFRLLAGGDACPAKSEGMKYDQPFGRVDVLIGCRSGGTGITNSRIT